MARINESARAAVKIRNLASFPGTGKQPGRSLVAQITLFAHPTRLHVLVATCRVALCQIRERISNVYINIGTSRNLGTGEKKV